VLEAKLAQGHLTPRGAKKGRLEVRTLGTSDAWGNGRVGAPARRQPYLKGGVEIGGGGGSASAL
jgi:hypothetical protein